VALAALPARFPGWSARTTTGARALLPLAAMRAMPYNEVNENVEDFP
jgi:hypothetical protein